MTHNLNALALPDLFTSLTSDGSLDRLVQAAMLEDLGEPGDITSEMIVPPGTEATAALNLRTPATLAGLQAIPALLDAFPCALNWTPSTYDGTTLDGKARLGEIRGSLQSILAVERTLLNLVSRLSGVATLTREYVRAVSGTHAVICDTRKTTPGLRSMEKYAVRCGGGTLHRLGLFDAVLIKDNHLAGVAPDMFAATAATAALQARQKYPELQFVEVEVDTLEQLSQLLRCPAGLLDIILLDNMNCEQLQQAVQLRDASEADLLLEASGGIDRTTVGNVAQSGVDRISVGALTHQAVSVDIGLDVK